jgi:hypothetical protein
MYCRNYDVFDKYSLLIKDFFDKKKIISNILKNQIIKNQQPVVRNAFITQL